MSVPPIEVPTTTTQDPAALPDELRTFARIEGLVGQERALLAIPRDKRTDAEHARLEAITAELDRVADKLRERTDGA